MRDLSLHLLDLAQNSVKAGASLVTIRLTVAENGWLTLVLEDDGCGMDEALLNRVKSPDFPDTIPGVIFDRVDGVQFEPVKNGTVYDTPTAQSLEAARRVLEGENVVSSALYFYAPALSQGVWINANRTYTQTIGCHRFYL